VELMGGLNAPLGVEDTITLSCGFDATPFWQGEVSPLLARADGAHYVAKRKGRNHIEVA
jgi:PleD family two-component response regulator